MATIPAFVDTNVLLYAASTDPIEMDKRNAARNPFCGPGLFFRASRSGILCKRHSENKTVIEPNGCARVPEAGEPDDNRSAGIRNFRGSHQDFRTFSNFLLGRCRCGRLKTNELHNFVF